MPVLLLAVVRLVCFCLPGDLWDRLVTMLGLALSWVPLPFPFALLTMYAVPMLLWCLLMRVRPNIPFLLGYAFVPAYALAQFFGIV